MFGSHAASEPSLFKDTHLSTSFRGRRAVTAPGTVSGPGARPAGLTDGQAVHSGSEARSIFSVLGPLKDVLLSPLGHPLSRPQRKDSNP